MSPNLIGVIIGIAFVVPTIYVVNKRGFDAWVWPVFLVTLPIYYMCFGLLVMDSGVILLELLYGLPFILIGLLAWKIRFRYALYLVAILWISHGFYDYYHELLFVNPGVFSWYPAFCAFVDIAVGGYLLANSRRLAGIFSAKSSLEA